MKAIILKGNITFLQKKIRKAAGERTRATMHIVHFVRFERKKLTPRDWVRSLFNDSTNPFPQRVINSKRSHHFQIIRAQLEELENEKRKRKTDSEEKVAKVDYMSEED
ncbi:hypothetical protein HNY73_022005 [Argiope bruennichi]|uniref:Uncharacterized protein n=1 Tax=Argiope bruennichi TaxID=94029 RepID=A0A8T0E352_ARGBR|nr:hypothetical protein HNY73_022005 [Argiope bruennichi]